MLNKKISVQKSLLNIYVPEIKESICRHVFVDTLHIATGNMLLELHHVVDNRRGYTDKVF